jgi:hypothetical protein
MTVRYVWCSRPRGQQLAYQVAHAARGMEVVHVGGLPLGYTRASSGVTRESSSKSSQSISDAGGTRHRHQVQRVVRGAAGGGRPTMALTIAASRHRCRPCGAVLAQRGDAPRRSVAAR